MTGASTLAITRLLGYSGLLPFVAAALYSWVGTDYSTLAIEFAGIYALAILCFIYGSWWGMGRDSGTGAALLLSNLFLLLALGLYLLAGSWWSLCAALLLVGAWLCEQVPGLFLNTSREYRRMRGLLSLIAGASMIAVQLAANSVRITM